MKLTIAAVGHRQPGWVDEGCADYLKRMPRELPTRLLEIKPEPRGSKSREALLAAEKNRLLEAIAPGWRRVALDERGEDLDTLQFSRRLETWRQHGRDTVFLIGGADGLDTSLKTSAEACLRLSSLTLPHGLARLLLCEQLYRAASLLGNHPYHRAG